ncbi:hypothetical protein [Deinococcus pimensis]|uniref:hypothetical protein n=1 Tax=Deinococcus pimensis TaxID=309888 RepID=UPI000486507F|nr:hypothetical protein [Deinococcus pimensis]
MNAHLKWMAVLILGMSLAACGEPLDPPTDGGGGGNVGGGAGSGGSVPSALQGEWHAGQASPIGYYDPSSGAWQGANGTSFILKLRADGTYDFTGLMVTGSGSCQSKILSTETGRATVDGDKMTLTPTRGDVQSTVCGGPVNHADVTPSTKRWALSVDDYGKETLFTNNLQNDLRSDMFYRTDRTPPTYPKIGIQGTVKAPAGQSVAGTLVIACYKNDPQCLSPARKMVTATGSGDTGTFSFPALDDRDYFLQAIRDVDGDGKLGSGDLVDIYSTNDAPGPIPAVRPPATGVQVDLVVVK